MLIHSLVCCLQQSNNARLNSTHPSASLASYALSTVYYTQTHSHSIQSIEESSFCRHGKHIFFASVERINTWSSEREREREFTYFSHHLFAHADIVPHSHNHSHFHSRILYMNGGWCESDDDKQQARRVYLQNIRTTTSATVATIISRVSYSMFLLSPCSRLSKCME